MNKNYEMQTQNMMQTFNNSMLNNTNTLYVFNPILLTSVFAVDLLKTNSTILISKNLLFLLFITKNNCHILLPLSHQVLSSDSLKTRN